ncbi:MAG TPA: vanadium-dependent haloperoxidase [Bauldia sp.]|nr:vanadium-dependent haloperoxidase [Bauldia sp.]
MRIRRVAMAGAIALAWLGGNAQAAQTPPEEVARTWTNMVLLLTRHTPTYTPPVASRTFAYLSVAAYEAVASGSDKLQTLAGQLNELTPSPQREAGQTYDNSVILEATMSAVIKKMFENTGPTGLRAYDALAVKLEASTQEGVTADVVDRSKAYGASVAAHILDWAKTDGGDVVTNMGFPEAGGDYKLNPAPGHWLPTNVIVQQQLPLLPKWGENRPFAMPRDGKCDPPPALEYSEDPNSAFYKEAKEVYDTKNNLTPEQQAIARFWSDDPMLSWTPPGHWISIVLQILARDQVPLEKSVDILARLSVAEADAFIGCWKTKYVYDLIRPLTYIKKVIDPKWETLINTPPFPEYTSGHSVASAAAALVLTTAFGDNFAFDDSTGKGDGLGPRHFASFNEAAEQAGISRLYGGIHFRAAIENGLAQGRCIGAYTVALKTLK